MNINPGTKYIDLQAMRENAAKEREKTSAEFSENIRKIGEVKQKKSDELQAAMLRALQTEKEQKRVEMEHKIEKEKNETAEKIRAEYEKETPAYWNESPIKESYRNLARSLNK